MKNFITTVENDDEEKLSNNKLDVKVDNKTYKFNGFYYDLVYVVFDNDKRKKIFEDNITDDNQQFLKNINEYEKNNNNKLINFDQEFCNNDSEINKHINETIKHNRKNGYNTRAQVIINYYYYNLKVNQTKNDPNDENIIYFIDQDEIFKPKFENWYDIQFSSNLFYVNDEKKIFNKSFEKLINLKTFQGENSSGGSIFYVGISDIKIYLFKTKTVVNSGYIKLPEKIAKKQVCINIENKDNYCFIYCYLFHLYGKEFVKKDPQRPSKYKFKISDNKEQIIIEQVGTKTSDFTPINIKGINLTEGITEKDIRVFEKLNNISVNLFYVEEENNSVKYSPLPSLSFYKDKMNLLILSDDKLTNKNVINNHCVYIKNLNGLFFNKETHNTTFVCEFCLNGYSTEESKNKCFKFHVDNDEEPCQEIYPKEGKNIVQWSSKDVKKCLKNPYFIACDFEAFTTKKCVNNCSKFKPCVYCLNGGNITKDLKVIEQHIPASYGLYLIDVYNPKNSIKIISQPEQDLLKFQLNFVEDLQRLKKIVKLNVVGKNIKLEITEDLTKIRNETNNCYLCNSDLKNTIKHIDHDHLDGSFRGIACQECNTNLSFKGWKLPVIVHNLKSYDSHFIVKALANYKSNVLKNDVKNNHDFEIIPLTAEKYLSISFDEFKFIDSYQFLSSSLETLGKNLTHEQKFFTKSYYDSLNISNEITFDDFCNKGFFPYSWFDDFSKFNEVTFPNIKDFKNLLNDSNINEKDYKYANKVYGLLCKNFKDYHDVYLTLDITILADVWLDFQQFSLKTYKLDPNNFVSLPNMSDSASKKLTGVKLELLTDKQIDIYKMFEKGIRGGICMTFNRQLEVKNTLIGNHDDENTNEFALYMDANNLYGKAMSMPLPTGDFKMINNEEEINKNFDNIVKMITDYDIENNNKGYAFNVDLHIPADKHEYLNGLCPAPELKEPTAEIISDFNKKAYEATHKGKFKSSKKLILDLCDKKDYICHVDNLRYYLKLGCVITKINYYVEFTQSKWLERYIMYNTELRTKATNDSDKDKFKLMNNSVFGKQMEQVKKRRNFKLHCDENKIVKNLASSLTKQIHIFDENLFGFDKRKSSVLLNKPQYVGFCILELSKLVMYKYAYDYLYPRYGRDNVKPYYMDTDSLIFTVKTKNFYKDMIEDSHMYDLSEYKEDHIIYDYVNEKFNNDKKLVKEFMNRNKKVPAKFKDENTGGIITNGLFIKSKCYYVKSTDNKEIKKNKGVNKHIVKKELFKENYENSLKFDYQLNKTNIGFRSMDHNIYTVTQNKTCLNSLCDKVYILDDGITSYSYGHKNIAELKQ